MIARYKPPRRWSDPDLLGRDTLIRQAVNRLRMVGERTADLDAQLANRLEASLTQIEANRAERERVARDARLRRERRP